MSHNIAIVGMCAALLTLAACSDKSDDGGDGGAGPAPIFMPRLAMADTSSTQVQTESLVQDVSPSEVLALIELGDMRMIDVRTDEEVAQGILPGAEHIAISEFDPAAVAASDERPILLYCRSGRRSRLVGEALAKHTGETVDHLEGGILAWGEAGYPVEQP